MNKNASRSFRYYWIVLPLFLTLAIATCGLQDTLNITILIPACLLIFLCRKTTLTPTLPDLLVLGILIWEILLQFTTINPIASFPALQTTTAANLYYFALRLSLCRPRRIRSLLTTGSLLFGLLALIGIVAFFLFQQRITAGGFNDLYDFRFLFMPLGNLTNTWGNLLLGFLGTILLALHYSTGKKNAALLILTLLPVGYGLTLTFSRGIYLSLGFLLIALIFYAFTVRKTITWTKLFIATAVLTGATLMILPHSTEILRTLRVNESISQQRSIEGRVSAAETALLAFREHPTTGAGSNNYSLLANTYLYENAPGSYTANASSLLIQAVTEKGIIGTVLWVALFLSLSVIAVRSRKKSTTPLFITILIAMLLIRELTFPVLLDNSGLLLILFTWIAIFQNTGTEHPLFTISARTIRLLRWLPLIGWSILLTCSLLRRNDNDYTERSLQALRSGDPSQALKFIDHTRRNLPGLINRSTIRWELFRQSGDTSLLSQAASDLRTAISLNPRDLQLQHNLALMQAHHGEIAQAIAILDSLTNLYPGNPLYQSSLFNLLYRQKELQTAAGHLAEAIRSDPSLLDTPLCTRTVANDPSLDSTLRKLLTAQGRQQLTDPISLAKQARILLHLGDTLTCRTYLEETTRRMPGLPRPWCYLGMISYRNGEPGKGRRCLQAALAISPADPLARYYWKTFTGESLPPVYRIQKGSYGILYSTYYAKYQHWYRSQPIPFDDLSDFDSMK